MAVIQFFGRVNMSASQTTVGNITGTTATQLTITDGNNTSIYGGNFTYSNNEVFGTLTNYQQLQGPSALEKAGVEFIPENGGGAGVRMKKRRKDNAR